MDKAILVGPDIEEGKRLLEKIDQSDLKVTSAFWYYVSESEIYRLVIVTPFFEKHGPRKTYEKIQKILRNNNDINLSLGTISVMGPNDHLNKILKAATNAIPEVSGVRLTGNAIHNTYIEDAYLYRIG